MAIKIKNSTIIDDSRNLVDVGISTVTSLSIGSTEVINSSRQLKNIASLDATTTATIESAIANAPNTFTDLNVTGISTLNVVSANSLNVTGVGTITTLDVDTGTIDFLSGTSINASGIVTATTFSGNLENTLTLNTSGTGLSGSTTFNNSGAATFTVASNATSDNTGGTIVARDGSGNFSAGIITATTFDGDLIGNADTATALETPRTFEITGDIVGSPVSFDGTGNVSIAATIQPNSVALGDDTTGNYVATISGTANEVEVSGSGNETAAVTVGLPNDVVIQNDLQVNNDTVIQGNLTVYGTETIVNTQSLNVFDKDIILGIGTENGETDDTANGGGIAIASTEGSPLICLQCGVNTLPGTYKQLLWLKNGTFAGLATDAWVTNYAVSIGSTIIDFGSRLAVGDIQFTDDDLKAVRNINASGIITATTFDGNLATSNLTGTISNSQLAGFIANDKLVNSTVNFGGVTVSLGGTDATPAFDLQDATGLPISTGVAGLGANVATFLATPSSSNLASAVTDETGSGALVFATSPTLVSPTLGAASATSLTASGAVTANTYNVGTDVGISTTRTTVATTSATTIESFAIATYRSARVQVQITQGTDYQTSDVLIIHDGSTASVIEYASIATDDYLGTFTGAVSGGNCLLQINMSSSSSATVKVLSQLITV